MPLKWKSQHFLGFPFPLSLVSILEIKTFHVSTSTSAIILKIQIKKYFLFFSIFSHFRGNQTMNEPPKTWIFLFLPHQITLAQQIKTQKTIKPT